MSNHPIDILEQFYSSVSKAKSKTLIKSDKLRDKLEFICRCNATKGPIRFLMSCTLAKISKPEVDIQKPYTEIGDKDSFSGRGFDEEFIEGFIHKYKLPCNSTTAFLSPVFRNIDRPLIKGFVLVGRPRMPYDLLIEILDVLHNGKETPDNVLKEVIRVLIIIKEEDEIRMTGLLAGLSNKIKDFHPLSTEEIVTLLLQHLNCNKSSRLPTLIIAAAYMTVKDMIGEKPMTLQSHNAADKQTGSLGDIEVILTREDRMVTCYEMKDKSVTKNDIDHALQKLSGHKPKIDNYIFITTDLIDTDVAVYAKSLYNKTGIEFAILDCIGFIRHLLHFFHRVRTDFLNIYQGLVIKEPTSSVSQPLKEAFLVLRKAAESEK
jgi:hypothetical protein